MECTFHSVNLLCADIHKQSSFISFMFDVEIQFAQGHQYAIIGGVRVNLIQATVGVQNTYPSFELSMPEKQDLKDFKQKLELYAYKSFASEAKYSLGETHIDFEDPCGNLWRVKSGSDAIVKDSADALLM